MRLTRNSKFDGLNKWKSSLTIRVFGKGQISPLVAWTHGPASECNEETCQDTTAIRVKTIQTWFHMSISWKEWFRCTIEERCDANEWSSSTDDRRMSENARTYDSGNDLSLRHLSYITLVPGRASWSSENNQSS